MTKSNTDTLLLLGLGLGAILLFRNQIGGALGGVAKTTSGIGDAIQGTGTGISRLASSTADIGADFAQTLDKGTDVIGTVFGQAQRLVQGTGDTVANVANKVKSGVNSLIDKATSRSSSSSKKTTRSSGSYGPLITVANSLSIQRQIESRARDEGNIKRAEASRVIQNAQKSGLLPNRNFSVKLATPKLY